MPQTLKNDLLLRALAREPTPRTPCWLMRQAGRYLPEYRAIRQQVGSFTALLRRPETAAELAMQPLRRYELDAAIVFSDILVIPDAMGMGLELVEGGPRFARSLNSAEDAANLRPPQVEKDLGHVLGAVRETRRALAGKVPLIGFVGSPWTIFTYMVQTEPEEDRRAAALRFALAHPEATQHVLNLLATTAAELLRAQQAAGADALMIFDSWGGALGERFADLSLPFVQRIVQNLNHCAPVILYLRRGEAHLGELAQSGCDCLGLDWTDDLGRARRQLGGQMSLQGNFNPELLTTTPAEVRSGVAQVLQSYGEGPGHIFNLGQGIRPDADPELVGVLVDAVRTLSTVR